LTKKYKKSILLVAIRILVTPRSLKNANRPRRRMNKRLPPFACVLALLPAACLAQTAPPEAGILQPRSAPAMPPAPQPATAASPVVAPRPAAPRSDIAEGSLEVRAFRFSGDLTGLPVDDMQRMLAGDTGKVVTLKELHGVAARIERWLLDERRRIVAKAWVPLQDVQEGVVEIRVLQGTVGQLRTDPKLVAGAARDGALAAAGAVLAAGAPIVREPLEEAVYRVSDYLGMPARAVLVPAAKLGEYDLVFEVEQGRRVNASAGIDNTGNRYTTEWHDALSLRVANLSGRADQLALYAQALTPNQRNLHLNYQLPVGRDWRLGATAQASRYRLTGVFAPLEAKGDTRMLALNVSRAVQRSRARNLYLSAELLQRRLENEQLGFITSKHKVSELTLGARTDWTSGEVLGNGWLNLSLGHVDVDAAGADAVTDPTSARLHGRFAKLGFGVSRTQPLGMGGTAGDLVARLSGQLASKNLDSSETFLLGGMGAVRAYPAGETAGDQSAIAQIEYHRRLREGLRAFAFYDHGWIELHRHPWTGFTGRNRVQLKGTGVGVAWTPHRRVELSLIGAVKVGRNPLADPVTGNDSDGRSRRYRIWSFATVRY
jgi:hemolysin activation/secretion protein